MEAEEGISTRELFGSAITMQMPDRFKDISNYRPVPDHQEVLTDANTDQSVIVEVLVRVAIGGTLHAAQGGCVTACKTVPDESIMNSKMAIVLVCSSALQVAHCTGAQRLQERAEAADSDAGRFYWQDCCSANEAQAPNLQRCKETGLSRSPCCTHASAVLLYQRTEADLLACGTKLNVCLSLQLNQRRSQALSRQ